MKFTAILSASLALGALAIGTAASAQAPAAVAPEEQGALEMRAEQAVEVLRGERAAPEVFSESFLAAVSPAQLQALAGQLTDQFGALQGVESLDPQGETSAALVLRFERALGTGMIAIEDAAPQKVSGFRLTGFEPLADSADSFLSDLQALPGRASVLLVPVDAAGLGKPVVAHNPDTPLALGSTFKLYVLSALLRQIEAGARDWDDVVPLTARSFPSGITQDWPEGAPVTLHTLATLMISISDNTATDQLIAVLGQDALARELTLAGNADAAASLPFLSTRQLFAIKTRPEAFRIQYQAADPSARSILLADAEPVALTMDQVEQTFSGDPVSIDIEWFGSSSDIARLMHRFVISGDTTALGILAVSPSLSATERPLWDYAGFKGGSEPGVLNMSWLLRNGSGQWYVATLGWNDPAAPVSATTMELLAQRLIRQAR